MSSWLQLSPHARSGSGLSPSRKSLSGTPASTACAIARSPSSAYDTPSASRFTIAGVSDWYQARIAGVAFGFGDDTGVAYERKQVVGAAFHSAAVGTGLMPRSDAQPAIGSRETAVARQNSEDFIDRDIRATAIGCTNSWRDGQATGIAGRACDTPQPRRPSSGVSRLGWGPPAAGGRAWRQAL